MVTWGARAAGSSLPRATDTCLHARKVVMVGDAAGRLSEQPSLVVIACHALARGIAGTHPPSGLRGLLLDGCAL
jgi:hypothetical protein